MEKDWIKIRTYSNVFRAEIVKQMLLENDIPAVVLNKQDSSYHFGRLELYVAELNRDIALKMIDENEAMGIEDDINSEDHNAN